MLRISFFASLIFLLSSCASSSKAFEKGQNKKAIRLAKYDLKKNKNVEENIAIINKASEIEIDKILELNAQKISSPQVEDWISVQNSYFSLLENIGEANQLAKGKISKPYDRLCEHKNDLDYKIAEHYYKEGEELLVSYENKQEKSEARKSYYSYKQAKDYGAEKYYGDLTEKMDYCIEKGRVYFIAYNCSPSKNLFFRPLPQDVSFEADCILRSTKSGYATKEKRSQSTKTYDEEIEVGKEAITDTSGTVTYEPIYETVFAYENTTKITVTLSTTTWINVKNNTGQCHKGSWSFQSEVSDTYEEVRYTGDSRAYPILAKDKVGQPISFMSDLERELRKEVDKELR